MLTADGVLVPYRLAAVLAGPLRRLITDDARTNGTTIYREVLDLLDALDTARRAVGAAGTAAPAPRYRPCDGVSVTEYATATGRSPRSVRRSCERGTVPAVRYPSGWRINLEESE